MLKLSKEYEFNSSIDDTWRLLTDLSKVTRCIPNIEDVKIEDYGFKASVKPPFSFIRGRFKIESKIKELREKEFILVYVKGSSIGAGFEISMSITISMLEGITRLKADIIIDTHGLLKTVPNSLVYKVVDDIEGYTIKCIKEQLSNG
jgi:carbon monoxide dehydrogenase subunit G